MTPTIPLRVGFLQFAPRFGDPEGNLETVREALWQIDADVVVLPELAFTGYCFRDRGQLRDLAEVPDDSPCVEGLASLCRRRDMRLVTGFAERDGERIFNSALLIGPAGLEARYRKLHLFDREKEIFDPGNLPLNVFDLRGVRVGLMVCFDWAFPEVARTLALRGADLICHPANLVLDHCQRAMRVRCTENRLFAVTANRCGTEAGVDGPLTFTGRSQVTAPGGEVLCRAPAEGRLVQVVEIDVRRARDKRITARNHLLADRRPEFYGGEVSQA